ncbi:MAG: DUF1134 domain-containing protein [Novosphingobium sp.]
MIIRIRTLLRSAGIAAMGALALAGSVPAPAQVQPVDPDKAIDGDLNRPATAPAPVPAPSPLPAAVPVDQGSPTPAPAEAPADPAKPETTYHQDDLIGAAEGVFGKGAKGVADVIQDILKKQGEPNAYIVGREGGGALVVGVRYGSGTLFHKVEGQRPVYWTGPSVGFDAGASAGSTFVLVYNLYNSDELYHRFPAGEGQAYLIGGFNVSYMRRGNIVLIPVRSGVGLRLGVNAGYMKFSQKHKWLPF